MYVICTGKSTDKKGLIAANPELEVSTFEIADGGEGMVDAFVEASQGQIRKASCF